MLAELPVLVTLDLPFAAALQLSYLGFTGLLAEVVAGCAGWYLAYSCVADRLDIVKRAIQIGSLALTLVSFSRSRTFA